MHRPTAMQHYSRDLEKEIAAQLREQILGRERVMVQHEKTVRNDVEYFVLELSILFTRLVHQGVWQRGSFGSPRDLDYKNVLV